jgi:hypothetical protein
MIQHPFAEHVALRITLLLLGATCAAGCRLSDDSERMAEVHGEDWEIDGRNSPISATFYERSSHGSVTYVVVCRCFSDQDLFGLDDTRAFDLARPILAYVREHRTYERSHFLPVRGTVPPDVRIAVDLLPKGEGRMSEYRLVVSLGELVWRLRQSSADSAAR